MPHAEDRAFKIEYSNLKLRLGGS